MSDLFCQKGRKTSTRIEASGQCDVYFAAGKLDITGLTGGVEDPDGPTIPRFRMVGYTGNPMKLRGTNRPGLNYSYPIVLDLAGLGGLGKSRPILKDHDQGQPLGHTDHLGVENHQLVAVGPVSNWSSPQGQEVISSSKNGFPWQASVGADIIENEFVPAGKTAEANGRTYSGPVNIARKSVLGEISFVALGADDDTSASIAAVRNATVKGQRNMKFKAWAKAKGFDEKDLEGPMAKGLRAAYRASAEYDAEDPDGQEPKVSGETSKDEDNGGSSDAQGSRRLDATAARGSDTAGQGVRDVRAESVRIAKVNAAVDTASSAATGELATKLAEIRANAIEQGWDEEKTATQVELATLRAGRAPVGHADGQPFNIHTGGAGVQMSNDIIAASVALSAGLPEAVALTRRDGTRLSEAEGNVAVSARMRGMGLQRMMGLIASAHGVHVAPGALSEDDVRAVMRAERRLDVLGDGGYSTVSLLGITENIMNKGLLAGYGQLSSVVPDIAYETDTNDFKPFKRYRMSASGRMQPVNDAGELKSLGLQDESYPNQLDTVGAILTLTRKTIINDDMSAITEAPAALGREAFQCREETVMTTLLAALGTLFPTDGSDGNYISGSATALSIDAITTAVQKFMEQRDVNQRPINLVPDRILVPPALLGTASEIYKGTAGAIVTALGSTSSKAKEPNVNIHAGSYKPVVSAFMAARGGSGLAGSSDTGWLLLTNPSGGFAVVQVGYLRGQRTPTIERGDAPFTTLGIQLRCYFDFGAAAHDGRCGVYSKGKA